MTDKDVTALTRDELIAEYTDLVEGVVRRLWNRCVRSMTLEDMRSCGYVGLLQAAERYDPDQRAEFESFAFHRIRGEILDGRRRSRWGPRSQTVWCRDDSTADKLQEASRLSAPEVESSSSEGKPSMPACEMLFLEPAEFGDLNLAADQRVDERMTRQQLKSLIGEALDQLGEIERAIVRLHDIEGETITEVAEELCCSKSWAAKLRERALGEIKEYVREAWSEEETDEDGEAIVDFSSAIAA